MLGASPGPSPDQTQLPGDLGASPPRSSGGRSIPLPSLPQHSQGENQREQRRERLRVTLSASRSRRGQRDPHPWVTRPWHTSLSPTGAGTGQGGGRSKPCTTPPRHLLCAHGGSSPRHISLLPPETTGAAGRGAGQAAFGVILSFPPHRLPPHARAQPGMHQIGFSISSCKCAENISKRATRGSSCPLCLSSGWRGEGKRGAGR